MVQQQLCAWGVHNNQTRCSVCPTLYTPVRTKWPVHKSKYLVFFYLTLKLEFLFCFGLNSLYIFDASFISYVNKDISMRYHRESSLVLTRAFL